jgi:catechol 2,3-dioxygenase-like lactoylglutathione lyase family enzyme
MSVAYPSALFHVGVRVPDLDRAMAELGAGLGITWAGVMEREQQVWTPQHGTGSIKLRFTYSCAGPQHVELLQGEPGSFWDGDDAPGVHHAGVWVDDLPAEVQRLEGAGWTLELAGKPPEDGYGSMAYLRSPTGFLLEPVSTAVRPRFERWWSGGPFA